MTSRDHRERATDLLDLATRHNQPFRWGVRYGLAGIGHAILATLQDPAPTQHVVIGVSPTMSADEVATAVTKHLGKFGGVA